MNTLIVTTFRLQIASKTFASFGVNSSKRLLFVLQRNRKIFMNEISGS